jgi:hypothetical protein
VWRLARRSSGILGAPMQRRPLTALAVSAFLTILVLASATPASAAQMRRTWRATIAGGGTTATAVLVLTTNNTGAISVSVDGLKPSTTYAQMIYKGTCSSPITLVKLPGIRTNSSGHGERVVPLGSGQGAAVWSVGPTGSVAFRISTSGWARCAVLTYAVATRVAIQKYGIDLPVVYRDPGQFPYCNVAMYVAALSQPGEAGPTMIYGHARTGMFLPLLTASKINDGRAMLGMLVQVWTSDSKLYTYTVTRVMRHVYGLPTNNFAPEVLWLQTSEGPNGTPNKLFVLAQRVGIAEASYASHPNPHIVICH